MPHLLLLQRVRLEIVTRLLFAHLDSYDLAHRFVPFNLLIQFPLFIVMSFIVFKVLLNDNDIITIVVRDGIMTRDPRGRIRCLCRFCCFTPKRARLNTCLVAVNLIPQP